jgi:hypothetical protein
MQVLTAIGVALHSPDRVRATTTLPARCCQFFPLPNSIPKQLGLGLNKTSQQKVFKFNQKKSV